MFTNGLTLIEYSIEFANNIMIINKMGILRDKCERVKYIEHVENIKFGENIELGKNIELVSNIKPVENIEPVDSTVLKLLSLFRTSSLSTISSILSV